MSGREVERICESIDPSGRMCLRPSQHTGRHRNGEHTWPNDRNRLAERVRADSLLDVEAIRVASGSGVESLKDLPPGHLELITGDPEVPAEPWVRVGFVTEPGDPEDTYRISVTCQGVTHYIGALIEGWGVAEAEARALADVLGRDAQIGPIWRESQCKESGWSFPVAGPDQAGDMKPLDGTLLRVYQEAVRFLRDLPDIPEVEGSKALSDALDAFEVAHSDLADSVWLTNFKASGQEPGDDDREVLAKALYESWCEGDQVGKACFSPYGWEDLKLMAEPDHTPTPDQFYQKADALLRGGTEMVIDSDAELAAEEEEY